MKETTTTDRPKIYYNRNRTDSMTNSIRLISFGSILLLCCCCYLQSTVVDTFSILPTTIRRYSCSSADISRSDTRHCRSTVSSTSIAKQVELGSLKMLDALFSESASIKVPIKSSSEEIFDKNGNKFDIGTVVRVAVDDIKQFQIPPKGLGSYNENKEFVQDMTPTPTPPTIKKFLAVPIGLRGTITKIYNVDIVSANYPIQVKFVTDMNIEEGYSSPVTFSMHFMPDEIECVIEE